jgi:hypothetical protein
MLRWVQDEESGEAEMPPEMQNGTTIAVMTIGSGKMVRRFDPNDQGKWVYIWVAGKCATDEFELTTTVGSVKLDREKTLREQGIIGRVMLAMAVL